MTPQATFRCEKSNPSGTISVGLHQAAGSFAVSALFSLNFITTLDRFGGGLVRIFHQGACSFSESYLFSFNFIPRLKRSGGDTVRWMLSGGLLCCLFAGQPAAALELDARLKAFGTASLLPRHDVQRIQDESSALDTNFDVRLMLRERAGSFEILIDHATTRGGGDSFAFLNAPGVTLDQTPGGDEGRAFDLSWKIEDGPRHRSWHRFDRLAVRYRRGDWSVTLGRQAISWGNGMVFQPMGLFSPFAPTTVDRDYKAGDDLFLVERLFANGSDLKMLVVGRKNLQGDIDWDSSSAALKWHGFAGQGEWELTAARHYRDEVLGFGARYPIGGALARADVVATKLNDSGWRVSGVVNIDYSLALLQRNAYVFAEYFHNGFGVRDLPVTPLELPAELFARLNRGEVFNLMRDYLAVGGSIEWHPLWNQAFTVIGNLRDGSALLQTSLSYEPGDHQRVQLGWLEPLGGAGKEFGGVPLLGEAVTRGGASTLFARWVYYF